MVKIYLAVTVDPEVFHWIERIRGTTDRSKFVNEILKAIMKKGKIKFVQVEVDCTNL